MARTGSTIAEMVAYELPSLTASGAGQVAYFTKAWQIYLAEALHPQIPAGSEFTESEWPEIANMLIADLVCYSIMLASLRSAISNVSSNGTNTNSPGSADPTIKHIVEGPAEIEWFDPTKSQSDAAKAYFAKSGTGLSAFDEIKLDICMKSRRLGIILGMCKEPGLKVNRIVGKDRPDGAGKPVIIVK